jgi:hypothetical protein
VARRDVPDPLEMRRLRYDPATPEAERDRVAAVLRAQGRREEAVSLYEGRPSHPDLEDDARWAIENGASFVLVTLSRMGREILDVQRRACAESAERLGRWYDAHRLYERLQDEGALARVRERLPGFRVAIPANKA